jgi:hypothetical protein
MNAVAKPVVKNKYWIVEEGGNKVATIQAVEEGGFAFVHDNTREKFASIKMISKKYNIEFVKAEKTKTPKNSDVYGFPCKGHSYNEIYDVARRLPIYTTSAKSRSYFCAGHYLIKFNNSWIKEFCPKLITLNRYEFVGPFKTETELQEYKNGTKHSH